MVQLRPLIVVTGTVHVDGGETNTVQRNTAVAGAPSATLTVRRKVSPDRRTANVIATDYSRKLKRLSGFILRTPYGTLVDPRHIVGVKELLSDIDKQIATRAVTHANSCAISNCVLWESLNGKRQTHVAGWLSARLRKGDPAVKAALPQLVRA